jgi:hypothetical protein
MMITTHLKNFFNRFLLKAALFALSIQVMFALPTNSHSQDLAEAYMQRMAAYFENPMEKEDNRIFAAYLHFPEQLTRPDDAAHVPQIILAAMRDATYASVLKVFFANTPGTAWQPERLRSASKTPVEPWGWIAQSKGSAGSIWFTLYKTGKQSPNEIALVSVSGSEQAARAVGAQYAEWREKVSKVAAEKRRSQEEAERLAPLKKNCFYNIIEKRLAEIVMSDSTMTVEEGTYGDIQAKARFKVSNNSPADISNLDFAVIINNEQGVPVYVGKYGDREKYLSGKAYWLNISLSDRFEVLAAQEVVAGRYSLIFLPLHFRSFTPLPTESEVMSRLVHEDGRWTYY